MQSFDRTKSSSIFALPNKNFSCQKIYNKRIFSNTRKIYLPVMLVLMMFSDANISFYLRFRYMIGQYVTVHGDVISHLNISQSRVEDGGLYACEASNR